MEPASQKRNQISAQQSRINQKRQWQNLLDRIKALVDSMDEFVDPQLKKLICQRSRTKMSAGFKKRELKGELKEIYDFLEIKP